MTALAELIWIAPEDARPNRWNPNVMDPEMIQKARASIQEFGWVDPITVREVMSEAAPYEVIDGEHRWKIALDDNIRSIPAITLGRVEDSVAQQLTIVLNETRGQADPAKLGRLLKDLMAKETKDKLLSTLPFTREALDRLTGIPTMTWDDLDRPNRPALPTERPSAWVERTYRMPKESAAVIDDAIDKVKSNEVQEVSDWQALELIAADFLGG